MNLLPSLFDLLLNVKMEEDYITDIIIEYEICLRNIKKVGWLVLYLKEHEQAYELCLEAVKQDGLALHYVKDPLLKAQLKLELHL